MKNAANHNYHMCQIITDCLSLTHELTTFYSLLTIFHVDSYDISYDVL